MTRRCRRRRESRSPDPAALLEVIAELQAAGVLDPATQERLVADLKQTDPSLWPALLQYFKTSVTRQIAERAAAQRTDRPGAKDAAKDVAQNVLKSAGPSAESPASDKDAPLPGGSPADAPQEAAKGEASGAVDGAVGGPVDGGAVGGANVAQGVAAGVCHGSCHNAFAAARRHCPHGAA